MTPDLGVLLTDPARIAEVPAAELPALVLRLAAVQSAVAARLAATAQTDPTTAGSVGSYTLTEAAALLHKSPIWLRRKAAAGRVPCARKVGRSWVFLRLPFDRLRERGIGG